jgi:hypothetical protein
MSYMPRKREAILLRTLDIGHIREQVVPSRYRCIWDDLHSQVRYRDDTGKSCRYGEL